MIIIVGVIMTRTLNYYITQIAQFYIDTYGEKIVSTGAMREHGYVSMIINKRGQLVIYTSNPPAFYRGKIPLMRKLSEYLGIDVKIRETNPPLIDKLFVEWLDLCRS
jgi:hypothetical protein